MALRQIWDIGTPRILENAFAVQFILPVADEPPVADPLAMVVCGGWGLETPGCPIMPP